MHPALVERWWGKRGAFDTVLFGPAFAGSSVVCTDCWFVFPCERRCGTVIHNDHHGRIVVVIAVVIDDDDGARHDDVGHSDGSEHHQDHGKADHYPNQRGRGDNIHREIINVDDCSSLDVPPIVKVAVLTEETGEVARAVLDDDTADLIRELVQVAAVAVAWLESL